MEGSSSSNTRGDQSLPQITPPPFVLDTSFQHEIHANVPLPDLANVMPVAEHGVSNPKGDRYARR